MKITKNIFVRLMDWFSGHEEFNWKEYLFQEHSEQFLGFWGRRLKYFRFVRGSNGFGSRPDEIILALRYDGENDLINIFQGLKINTHQFTEKPESSEQSKPHVGKGPLKSPSIIPNTKWIEQPQNQVIDNINLFIWCTETEIEFKIHGTIENNWQLTETEFRNSEQIELIFGKYHERIIDPPQDTKYCFCPKFYPEYWT
ncbi:MAG: hypothetical protein U0Z26_04995 [Anaerolineales bacterium]